MILQLLSLLDVSSNNRRHLRVRHHDKKSFNLKQYLEEESGINS